MLLGLRAVASAQERSQDGDRDGCPTAFADDPRKAELAGVLPPIHACTVDVCRGEQVTVGVVVSTRERCRGHR